MYMCTCMYVCMYVCMYINVCESGLARGVVQKKYFFVTQLFLVCDDRTIFKNSST